MDLLHRQLYIPEIVVNALNMQSSRPLIELEGGGTLTVGEVRDAASQFIQALQSLGIGPGSRVGLLSPNRPEVLHVANASQIMAAIYSPMHPMGSFNDHLFAATDGQMDVLIFDADRYGPRAVELQAQIPSLKLLAFGQHESAEDLALLASSFKPKKIVAPIVNPDDVVRLGYSGGTTGKPKALASVQRTGLITMQLMMTEWEWPAEPRFLSCTPLSHAGAAMFIPMLLKGGTMLVLPKFDPVTVMQTIQERRINCIMLVPTMIAALLDHPRFDEFDLSSLETVFYGASAIAPARLKEAIERIGSVFMQFYGQAEAPMSICVLRKHEHDINDPLRLASCGKPTPWLHVELLDANNQPVADGEPGEICVRGPLVMNGYRDNPELTAEAFAGNWLHTGDVAIRDAEGFLRIVDRTKDMIITGGFNVYPRELEAILCEHPSVAEAAVFGVPHEKWGESVTAAVVLKPGKTADKAELMASVANRKGSFQAPKIVEFIDQIPQTPVGKPDKKALKAQFIAEQGAK